jgi:hypothetical protein
VIETTIKAYTTEVSIDRSNAGTVKDGYARHAIDLMRRQEMEDALNAMVNCFSRCSISEDPHLS